MNWYKGKLDPTFITIMDLIKDEASKYGDDKKSKINLLKDVRDDITSILSAPDSDKKSWWQFWK